MRPQGVVGALIAIAVGAILTYAVTFTMSGVSIHTVGIIIMLCGGAALIILLIRSATASRRRYEARQPQIVQAPVAGAGYPQVPAPGTAPVAGTRISTEIYETPRQRTGQPPQSPEAYRAP